MNKKANWDDIVAFIIFIVIGIVVIFMFFYLFFKGTDAGVVYTNLTDDCAVSCHNLLKKYWCTNGDSGETNYCKCHLYDCIKTPPMQQKPKDFSEYLSSSEVISSSSQECYKNGIMILSEGKRKKMEKKNGN